MTFEKRRLATAEMGYAVSQVPLLGAVRPIAASEATGPAVVFEGDSLEPRVLAEEPGGTMGFAPVPGRDDALFVITGFYPVFAAEQSGIHLYRAVDGFSRPWAGERIVDLPFVHRIMSCSTPGGDFLIAATVCGGKDHRDDWSKPGAVFAYRIAADARGPWEAVPVLESIHKNHGLAGGTISGVESLLVSGTEGVFALALPGATDGAGRSAEPWAATRLLDHEVSEMALLDVDGDGDEELVVVEPFHGDELAVYKSGRTGWAKIYSSELSFGHGLSVGTVLGEPVVAVGNRAGDKDLVCFRPRPADGLGMERIVVDPGAATAGTTILATAAGDAIIASNPEYGEYAIYVAR
ncbi:MAG: hypothetical protein ACLFUA_12670 [Spirochaetales bacterium]